MFRERSASEAGMTLVELMTAMFLGGMVLTGLFSVYAFAIGLWAQTEAKVEMHADGTLALEVLSAAASGAETYDLGNGKELHLTVPASPLDDTSRVRVRSFRLRDAALWLDSERLIPAPGDSAIGVSDFRAVERVDPQSGVLILDLGVQLFSREKAHRPSDSIWFGTSVHLRNRGLMGGAVTGSLATEASF